MDNYNGKNNTLNVPILYPVSFQKKTPSEVDTEVIRFSIDPSEHLIKGRVVLTTHVALDTSTRIWEI